MMVWGKKLLLCLVVLVYRVLWHLPEGKGWKSLSPGCTECVMFVSWSLKTTSPGGHWQESTRDIFSVCFSLLLSCFEAFPNQTVMNLHRMDWMTVVQNWFNSFWGRSKFLMCCIKFILCWAFLRMELMLVSHFRSWEMVVSRNSQQQQHKELISPLFAHCTDCLDLLGESLKPCHWFLKL